MEYKMVRLQLATYNRILTLQEPRETLSEVIDRCLKAFELIRSANEDIRATTLTTLERR